MWPWGTEKPPQTTADPDHVCRLAELPEAEAVRALVDVLRHTGSASAVVARLAARGIRLAREVG